MKRYYLGIFFIALAILTSCADQIVESTPSIIDENIEVKITAKFSDIQQNIFNQSCAFSGCHAGSVNPSLAGNSYSNLVNKISSTGIPYIKPNDPANSYVLQKIIGSNGISGSRMPLSAQPLSNEQISTIEEWINDGAQNN